MIAPSYTLNRVVTTVDGVPIEGYSDQDEAISFERNADAAELIVGADGFAVASMSTDRSMIVTLSISQLSPSYRYLSAKLRAQLDTPGPLVPVRFAMTDLNNGDKVTEPGAFFLNRPSKSKRRRAGFAEFRLALPRPEEVEGTLIVGGI